MLQSRYGRHVLGLELGKQHADAQELGQRVDDDEPLSQPSREGIGFLQKIVGAALQVDTSNNWTRNDHEASRPDWTVKS